MGAQRTFVRGKDGNRRVVNGWSEDRSHSLFAVDKSL